MPESRVLSAPLITAEQVSLKASFNVLFPCSPTRRLTKKYAYISCQNMSLSSYKSESWGKLTLASAEFAQALHLSQPTAESYLCPKMTQVSQMTAHEQWITLIIAWSSNLTVPKLFGAGNWECRDKDSTQHLHKGVRELHGVLGTDPSPLGPVENPTACQSQSDPLCSQNQILLF